MSEIDLYQLRPSRLVMYGTSWCPDSKRSKNFLENHKIDFLNIDIGKDNTAYIFLNKLTSRVRVPTLIFPDGTILIEPSDDVLSEKIGNS